ncbi:Ribosomal RNA processing protein 1 B [Rhizoclosmatium hyalinum]|nr:Ribosomal RNA processing protein 1 B [Rhizoclosmatium hyalinum]
MAAASTSTSTSGAPASAAAANGGGFGKNLAHTDKSVRDKAVHALSEWLIAAEDLSEITILKLWKGLFYCYWMSDKTTIQHELAERLAGIALDLSPEKAILYIRGFWGIIIREWPGLDRLRLDKFYNLLRNFHRVAFQLIEKNEFNEELVDEYMSILEEGPVSANNVRVSDGLRYHTASAYLDEMNNGISDEAEVPAEIGLKFFGPFIKAFATTTNTVYVEKLEEMFGKVADVLENNVRYEDEPEKKEFAVKLPNTRITQEIYGLINKDTTLFRNRKALNAVCARFFKDGGVKVEDVKGAQPAPQVGLRPLKPLKPLSSVASAPASAPEDEEKAVEKKEKKDKKEKKEKSEGVKEVKAVAGKEVEKPVVAAKETASKLPIPTAKAAAAKEAVAKSSGGKDASTKPVAVKEKEAVSKQAAAKDAPSVKPKSADAGSKKEKKGLKRPAEEEATPNFNDMDEGWEDEKPSPPKKAKLDSIAVMKPAAVAIATRINTEKNSKPIKIKATAAEIEELKKKAIELKKAGLLDKAAHPAIKKVKRSIVLKMENNTVKTFDKTAPIGMIPIEIPPFSPSKSALKVRK